MDDIRKQEITVTMTAEEWDSLHVAEWFGHDDREKSTEIGRMLAYASEDSEIRFRARQKIARATNPRIEDRFALAQAEAEARRPDFDEVLPKIVETALAMVEWHNNGPRTYTNEQGKERTVSHLGAGNGFNKVEGTDLTCWVMPGLPHMGFKLPEFKFGRAYPYLRWSQEQADAIKAALTEAGIEIVETWNDTTSSISIKFKAAR